MTSTVFPPGLRFVPNDREILVAYLAPKARNDVVQITEGILQEFDVYAKPPWDLPNKDFKYGVGTEAYYYTRRSRIGNRIGRTTSGVGTWVGTGHGKDITVCEIEVPGRVSHLSFREAGKKCSSSWVMDEYTHPGVKDWAVCRIKMNATATKKRMKEEAVKDENTNYYYTDDHESDQLQLVVNGWPDSFPPGFRFVPDHLQLVEDYLKKKAKNMPFYEGFILDYDVYTSEPWNLPYEFKFGVGSEAYYFTKRRHKSQGGSRIDRTTRNETTGATTGTWVANSQRKPIKDGQGYVVGHVTHLSFRRPQEKASSTWVMDEYTSTDDECKDWVVCRVKMNATTEKKKRKEEESAARTTTNERSGKKAKTNEDSSSDDQAPVTVKSEEGGGEINVMSLDEIMEALDWTYPEEELAGLMEDGG